MPITQYTPCKSELPPEHQPVLTAICDAKGIRNEQVLVRNGRLWFLRDLSMYVYYEPTHWKPLDDK